MNSSYLEKYRHLLSVDEMAELTQLVQRPLVPSIRVNTLKTDVAAARSLWPEWYGWRIRPVPFCAEGLQVMEHGQALSRTLEHRMGLYYIQDAASMLPAEMFSFDDHMHSLVLDLAAAPGGKTTHLVCKLNDRGLVVANDVSASRIGVLRSNLQDWGAMCTVITHYDGESYGSWFPEMFDKVLVDAPCSGENLRSAERRRGRPVSTRDRERMSNLQVRLLTSALQALKPGGEIVYSTCTLAPEEDEAVLDALLSLYPQHAKIESVDHILTTSAPALLSHGERQFNPEIRSAVRLWPHLYDTSGFFAARVSKRAPLPVQRCSPPRRSLSEAGFAVMSKQEQADVVTYLLETYGFDLGAIVERQGLTCWKREESVYAIPEMYLSHLADLRCVSTGMLLGKKYKEGFIPSHELVVRFGSHFTKNRLMVSDALSEVWLGGRDLRGLGSLPYPKDTVILLEDDKHRLLGRGKVLANRIRNMLPRRLSY